LGDGWLGGERALGGNSLWVAKVAVLSRRWGGLECVGKGSAKAGVRGGGM